jgi:ABC-type dipeptide/oligopeptide/nickel transport system, ATPase component
VTGGIVENNLILDIENLVVRFETDDGTVRAVNGLNLQLEKGHAIGLVGETAREKPQQRFPFCVLFPTLPGLWNVRNFSSTGRISLTCRSRILKRSEARMSP